MQKNVPSHNDKFKKMLKPNILYFAPCGLHEGVGGGARLRNMLDALRRLEANTQLISYLPGEKFKVTHKQIDNFLNTTTISVRRLSPKIFKVFALVPIFIYGLKHIRKSNIIFAHASGIVSGFPALILAKMLNKPLVLDHMDIKDPETPPVIYDSVIKNSNIVFTISRYLEEEARKMGCRNVAYVPVFIDPKVFRKDILEGVKIRRQLGIKDEEIAIGYAGSFSHIEGVPFLLKAFKKLSSKYKNVKLVVVGDSNVADSDNVAQLLNELVLDERVILVPPQPHKLMPKYLSVFDIACSPKIDCEENRAANPIKIYEYMSMGLPMVVSAVGEISHVIEDECDGFLVGPGDEAALERRLEYVIHNLDSLQEVGERARKKIIENYSQQAMLKKIADALQELCQERSH